MYTVLGIFLVSSVILPSQAKPPNLNANLFNKAQRAESRLSPIGAFQQRAEIFTIYQVRRLRNDTALYRLNEHLFAGYDQYIKPVKNSNTVIKVTIDFTLKQVLEINDQKETIQLSGWPNLKWTDELLTWNPMDYENISLIRIPVEKPWTPDIFLLNAASTDSWNQWSISYVWMDLYANGTIQATPPAIVTTACKLHLSDFPYDKKVCDLKFSSWQYTDEAIRLVTTKEKIVQVEYIENGAWNLTDTLQKVDTVHFSDQDGNYTVMTARFFFERRPLFYNFNFVLPCVLITLLSIAGFQLPVESGEKISLQITNLLAIVYFEQYLSSTVPQSSLGVPIMSYFLNNVSILCTLSLIGNLYVLHLHHTDVGMDKEMKRWFEVVVIKYLAKFLGIRPIESQYMQIKPFSDHQPFTFYPKTLTGAEKAMFNHIVQLNKMIKTMKKFDLKFIQDEHKKLKWKYAANCLNTLFFYLSILYAVIIYVTFFVEMNYTTNKPSPQS